MAKSYLERLLAEHEKIVLVSHQHWFILVGSIFLEVTFILIVFAVAIALTALTVVAAPLIVALGFILILIPIVTMTRDILIWTNRQYIITNRRVIQISGIINKNVTDSSLEKVNDVKMSQSFFGRLFGYGDVQILTASELGANLFKRMENPVRFKTAMLNAKEHMDVDVREFVSSDAHPRDIPEQIDKLDQLRKQGTITEEEFHQKKKDLLAKM